VVSTGGTISKNEGRDQGLIWLVGMGHKALVIQIIFYTERSACGTVSSNASRPFPRNPVATFMLKGAAVGGGTAALSEVNPCKKTRVGGLVNDGFMGGGGVFGTLHYEGEREAGKSKTRKTRINFQGDLCLSLFIVKVWHLEFGKQMKRWVGLRKKQGN